MQFAIALITLIIRHVGQRHFSIYLDGFFHFASANCFLFDLIAVVALIKLIIIRVSFAVVVRIVIERAILMQLPLPLSFFL